MIPRIKEVITAFKTDHLPTDFYSAIKKKIAPKIIFINELLSPTNCNYFGDFRRTATILATADELQLESIMKIDGIAYSSPYV